MQAQMQDASVMSRLRELQFAFVQWLSELVLWLTKSKEMFKFYHLISIVILFPFCSQPMATK
jgi:hypothetical protein